MITQKYKLNLIPDRVLPLVIVSQYDEARRIIFTLYNGEVLYTPTGTAKVLIGTEQLDATIDGNTVYFDINSDLTNKAQTLFGEVVLVNDGQLGTCNFRFKIDSTPIEGYSTSTDATSNQALSILLGKSVKSIDSGKAISIVMGE